MLPIATGTSGELRCAPTLGELTNRACRTTGWLKDYPSAERIHLTPREPTLVAETHHKFLEAAIKNLSKISSKVSPKKFQWFTLRLSLRISSVILSRIPQGISPKFSPRAFLRIHPTIPVGIFPWVPQKSSVVISSSRFRFIQILAGDPPMLLIGIPSSNFYDIFQRFLPKLLKIHQAHRLEISQKIPAFLNPSGISSVSSSKGYSSNPQAFLHKFYRESSRNYSKNSFMNFSNDSSRNSYKMNY